MSSALLRSVARATREYPLERKILLSPRRQHGRELLRALANTGTAWLGWEVAAPWQLALELVQEELARETGQLADEFRIMRLVDDAIDAVVARGNRDLNAAVASASFRSAIHRALALLRSSGRKPGGAGGGRILAATLEVLAEYEQRLAAEHLLDHADVMRRAVLRARAGARGWADARIFVLPAARFGLRGELVQALLDSGAAQLLESERVHGLAVPPGLLRQAAAEDTSAHAWLHAPEQLPAISASAPPHLFAAATPMDELREVLRRVVAAGAAWDQVEIVATDARTYGNALYALARRLGIPLTLANGIDLARTRTGRAVRGYLAWLRDAFPAEALRIMLESGDVGLKEPPGVPGARLAYRLRQLRIGWGRQRYYDIIERALRAALSTASPDDENEPQEAEHARERERNELRALRDIIVPILDAAPAAPPRLQARDSFHAPASIARGLLAFLQHVAPADESDEAVRAFVRERLERAAVELTRETRWDAAIAIVQRVVSARVSPEDEETAGWTAAPGRLHFSDLRSGGQSGRPFTFVVGLDASRVAANAGVDPILTDAARSTVLGLPTARERAALRRFELAELLAGLTGTVTLSFSAWDATEGRAVPPAMELLQALRLARRDADLTYSDLHAALGALAGPVPTQSGRLDGNDVWLATIASDAGVLHAATGLVASAYPHLQRGQRARQERLEPRFSAYHGKLRRAASANRLFSATQLETLGTCPRRYLYRYLLRIEAPETIEFDPEKWLDAAERGSLLHRTFERTLRTARARNVDYGDREFGYIALAAFEEAVALTRDRLPPPGEEILQQELRDLKNDLRQFVRMIRRDRPDWVDLEYRFGEGERPLVIDTVAGSMRVRGAIDRVDQLDDGRLVVVDYKTGRKYGYWEKRPFKGGRRIQHVVYSLAAERLLQREVARMEYHFPTVRGQNESIGYWSRQLAPHEEALARLLRLAQGDTFMATDDAGDCRFCDYAAACRVTFGDFGAATSPPAQWTREIGIDLPDADAFRLLRRWDA